MMNIIQSISAELLVIAASIRVAIFDVDGVLTDGRLYYSAAGEELKVFHVHDGHGLVMLREHNIKIAVISGRKSLALDKRLKELAFDFVYTGCGQNKISAFSDLIKQAQVLPKECSMMGDDIPDIAIFEQCGLSFAPANAQTKVVGLADYTTKALAGTGAVREVCELLLAAKAKQQH